MRPPGRSDLERELVAAADPERARVLAWFFKTGKGEYAEGDKFLGLTVPVTRRIALRYRSLPLPALSRLLNSKFHEYRLTALEILVAQFQKADEAQRQEIFDFYLRHTAGVNNWDLVDASAPYIVGEHLLTRPRDVLYRLAVSPNLWERRIAIVATFAFIKKQKTDDTYRLAEQLLGDKHDLIHKATGWALREAGKISSPALLRFLKKHYNRVPRTTLRYAIERFPADQRKQILKGNF